MNITLLTLVSSVALSACAVSTQRYYSVPDNTPLLKQFAERKVRVEPFKLATSFDSACRGFTRITPPVNMTFEEYFQRALADEFKTAGIYEENNPNVILKGTIDELDYSSGSALSNGNWTIGLKLVSSSGQSIYMSEMYSFDSVWEADSGCRRVADAFLPAVQNLITKILKAESFRTLLNRREDK
jgi:hypothetical protein